MNIKMHKTPGNTNSENFSHVGVETRPALCWCSVGGSPPHASVNHEDKTKIEITLEEGQKYFKGLETR